MIILHCLHIHIHMRIIDVTVKLSSSLDCDISLMDVIKKIQEKHTCTQAQKNPTELNACLYFASRKMTFSLRCFIILCLCFQRVKAGILKAFNNPTEKTADEETKRQVKGPYTCCARQTAKINSPILWQLMEIQLLISHRAILFEGRVVELKRYYEGKH